jgi:N-methylhydantoinase A
VRTFYARADVADPGELERVYAGMEAGARAMLRDAQAPEARWEVGRAADVRYPRQAYELTVPVGAGPVTRPGLERLAAAFHERHRQTYGHASPGEPVQIVNLRVSAVGRRHERLDLARAASARGGEGAKAAVRPVYFRETGLAPCDVVPRETLGPGADRPGPLVVESMDTTIVVPPGWRLTVDPRGVIVLEAARHA